MRALLILLVLASVRDAVACKCVSLDPVVGARRLPFAFVGRIVHETRTELNPDRCRKVREACVYGYSYTVAVDGVWKGKVDATVEVSTGSGHGDCSMGRLRDGRWIFVADEHFNIGLCSGTQAATPAVVDAMTKELGAPAKP